VLKPGASCISPTSSPTGACRRRSTPIRAAGRMLGGALYIEDFRREMTRGRLPRRARGGAAKADAEQSEIERKAGFINFIR